MSMPIQLQWQDIYENNVLVKNRNQFTCPHPDAINKDFALTLIYGISAVHLTLPKSDWRIIVMDLMQNNKLFTLYNHELFYMWSVKQMQALLRSNLQRNNRSGFRQIIAISGESNKFPCSLINLAKPLYLVFKTAGSGVEPLKWFL